MSDDKKEVKPCTITLEDGTHYDLNQLRSAKKDYDAEVGTAATDGEEFKLNVCRAVVTELWNVDDVSTVGGAIKGRERADFSLGAFSTNITLSPITQEPMLFYEGGSKCPGNENERASTLIRFVCSQTDFEAGKPQLVAALPPGDDACHFFFDWRTHVACPANPKAELESAQVWAFIGLVLVAILTWFTGHTLYNRCYLGRRGMEQFPIPHFSRPPGVRLPHNNISSSDGSARRSWTAPWKRRSQRAGYNHLRQDPDEEEHLASRFSLEDDEDHDDDARVLGGEMDAWRRSAEDDSAAHPNRDLAANGSGGSIGVHQGLVRL